MTSQSQSRPVLAICTACGYRWRAGESDLGVRIPCPECESPAVVRRATDEEVSDVADLAPDDAESWRDGPSVVVVGAEDCPSRSVRDKPPRWTYFSGVFTFPLYPRVFFRWVGISLSAVLAGHLAITAVNIGAFGGGAPAGAMLPAFYLLAAAIVLFFVAPYSASCFLTILRDTASGCNNVVDWPGVDFREWFLTPRFFLMMFGAAAGVGYGVQCGIDTDSPWPIAMTVFVLFPIFLLSSLEANSALSPISIPVYRSLFVLPGHWLVVYLEMAGIVTGLGLLFRWALDGQPRWAVAIAVCATVAGTLIYARILGRLAWRASRYEAEKEDAFAAATASLPNDHR